MKKNLLTIVAATVLLTCCLTGCGASATAGTSQESVTANTPDTSRIDERYASVLALKTANYQEQSVKDFNATVEAAIGKDESFLSLYSEALDAITPEDENYAFIHQTLQHSIKEFIMPELAEPVTFSRSTIKEDMSKNFVFTAIYSIEYEILDPSGLTISERDQSLEGIQQEIHDLIFAMSNEVLQAGNIRETLKASLDKLAQTSSTQFIAFKNVEIQIIEVHSGSQESTL